MLGYDLVLLTVSACCSWLPALLSPQHPEAVNETAALAMKGRRVAVEPAPKFSEAGMRDPSEEIAGALAASLAERYGLKFEPGRKAEADTLVLAMQTLEWIVEPGWKDYKLRYRGEATLVDRQNGHRLGRAWCDRNAPTGKKSYDEAMADRSALAGALHAAADSCTAQLREALLGG